MLNIVDFVMPYTTPLESKKYYKNCISLKTIFIGLLIICLFEFWWRPVLFNKQDHNFFGFLFPILTFLYGEWKIRKYPILTTMTDGIIWNYNGRYPTISGERYIQFREFKNIWVKFEKSRLMRLRQYILKDMMEKAGQ